eukprot:11156302-Lingulodinium_polyedra.AAC.1
MVGPACPRARRKKGRPRPGRSRTSAPPRRCGPTFSPPRRVSRLRDVAGLRGQARFGRIVRRAGT